MSYAQPLAQGTLLENRYCILGLLGQGGMSRVYLAEDNRLKLRVAIKENLQTTNQAHEQFECEAQILARLSHPNLPRVTDHFDAGTGLQYLVMDYVEGEDLDAMIKRVGPLPEATGVAWIRQVLSAVEYLHAQHPPVIHRDIKPANIKITPEGKAVLVDFGIAKSYDPRIATLTGARAITPGYAPPEQYGMRTTERSDLYALGATLYTMLTARVPPEAPLRQASEERLIPPSQLVRISSRTEGTILRALEIESTRRWQTVAELRAGLEGTITLPTPDLKPKQQTSRTILGVSLAALLFVAIVITNALANSVSRSGAALQTQATATARAIAAGTLEAGATQARSTQFAILTRMADATLTSAAERNATRTAQVRLTTAAGTAIARTAEARAAATVAVRTAQARAAASATARAEATNAAFATAIVRDQTATAVAELPVTFTVINNYRDMQDIWADGEFFLRVELRTTASAAIRRGIHTFVVCWRGQKPPNCGIPWTLDLQSDYTFTITED